MSNKFHNTIQNWFLAIRPKTLWAAIAPVLIGTSLAFSEGKQHWLIALATMMAAVLIQIGTNFANDYFDHINGVDTEKRLGPRRVLQNGLVKPVTMRNAYIFVFSLAFLIGIYLIWHGGMPILIIGILSILFGILYTSGPYPLSYNGLADIFVVIFFGPVAVGGTYYLQTLEINMIAIIAGLSPGLLSTAILTVNNLRDIDQDKAAGKKTLAVRFGPLFARFEYALMVSAACLLPLILLFINEDHPYVLATIFVFLFSFPTMKQVFETHRGPELNAVLAKTGKILLVYSIVFAIGWNI